MAEEIGGTPCPIKLTAADPARSRYLFPAESHTQTPSPRTARGNSLRNERRKTEERVGRAGAVTDALSHQPWLASCPLVVETSEPQSTREGSRRRIPSRGAGQAITPARCIWL